MTLRTQLGYLLIHGKANLTFLTPWKSEAWLSYSRTIVCRERLYEMSNKFNADGIFKSGDPEVAIAAFKAANGFESQEKSFVSDYAVLGQVSCTEQDFNAIAGFKFENRLRSEKEIKDLVSARRACDRHARLRRVGAAVRLLKLHQWRMTCMMFKTREMKADGKLGYLVCGEPNPTSMMLTKSQSWLELKQAAEALSEVAAMYQRSLLSATSRSACHLQ